MKLLALMPDTPATRRAVYFVDYERLYAATGVSRSPERAAAAEIGETIEALRNGEYRFQLEAALGFGTENLATAAAHFPLSGFSFADWDRAVSSIDRDSVHAVRGDFDRGRILRAVENCKQCQQKPFEVTHAGVTYYGWGNRDGLRLQPSLNLAPPLFDGVGRGGRFVPLDDETILRAVTDDSMKAMLDAAKGNAPSLADDADFVLAAAKLDELGLLTGFITGTTQGPVDRFRELMRPDQRPLLNEAHLLEPYSLLAFGQGVDAEGQYLVVILVHTDRARAVANEAAFRARYENTGSLFTRAPWQEYYTSAETRVEDRLLLVTLRGPGAANLGAFLERRDPLLLHR